MSGQRVFLIAGDGIVAHAGKKIIGLIVFAYVIETEPPIFALAISPLRRPMGGRVGAARPFAARHGVAQPAILVGLDANSVEEGRVEFHDPSLCGRWSVSRKLDNFVSPESGHIRFRRGDAPLTPRPGPG